MYGIYDILGWYAVMNAEVQGGRDEEYGFGTKTSMIWMVTAKWQSLEII